MEQSVIRQFQDEAEQAYIRLPQPEAAANAQVVMLAEIALQLAKLNAHLEKLAKPPVQRESDPDPFADPLEQAIDLLRQKDYTVTEIKIRLGLSTYEEAYDLCQVARKALAEREAP